jgi:hypothetical protein
MPKAPTHLATQTSKKVAVSRDWETAGWKRLISSPAHTQHMGSARHDNYNLS